MFYGGKEAAFRLRVSGLEDYLSYLKEIEKVINKNRDFVKQGAEEFSEEEQEDYWDSYLDEYDKYDSIFPGILRESIFISLFSYFEHQLMDFCEDKEKLKSIGGTSGLEKAKGYLSKHLGYSDLFRGKEWGKIMKYNKVRNCLVHAGGKVSLMKDERVQEDVKKFIKETKGIEIDDNKKIELDSIFCEDFVKVTFKFLEMTFNKFEEAP